VSRRVDKARGTAPRGRRDDRRRRIHRPRGMVDALALVVIPATALTARSLVRTADPTVKRSARRVRCADRTPLAGMMIKADALL